MRESTHYDMRAGMIGCLASTYEVIQNPSILKMLWQFFLYYVRASGSIHNYYAHVCSNSYVASGRVLDYSFNCVDDDYKGWLSIRKYCIPLAMWGNVLCKLQLLYCLVLINY